MNAQQLVVNLNSEQLDRLVSFYKDVIGLEPNFALAPGAFSVGGATFLVEGHSEVKGAAKEPHRLLLNFVVADAVEEQARLKAQGVHFVRAASAEPGIGIFATFLDPDGNYCQLVQLGAP